MPDARTLLLVDDDAATRELLTLLLTHAGWEVTTVTDGETALQALEDTTPNVILCDLQMPGLCGTALAEAVRERTTSPVLLAMTATVLPATPCGFDALLIKPFGPEAVAHHYGAVLGQVAADPIHEPLPEDSIAVLDAATLASLRKSMPLDRVVALLSFVVDDADTRIARMRSAADTGDDMTFRREAHALKGGCAMVGARRLAQLAADAEVLGLTEGTLTGWKSLSDFVTEMGQIRLMLKTLPFGDTRPAGHDQ